jgi:RNA polymerase sigma-70 factor, ECF subfamily
MESLTEPEIIKKAIGGDRSAFRWLVERHQSLVYSVSYKFLSNKADAEDATQEVFVRLWNNLSKYRSEIKLSTWLYKITTNFCLDVLRSKHNRQLRQSRAIEDHENQPSEFTADQFMINEELRGVILGMSEALTPKQKVIFVLRDLEELTVKEVCEVLSMSEGNIKSNLYYARLKMSELITQYYSERKKQQP